MEGFLFHLILFICFAYSCLQMTTVGSYQLENTIRPQHETLPSPSSNLIILKKINISHVLRVCPCVLLKSPFGDSKGPLVTMDACLIAYTMRQSSTESVQLARAFHEGKGEGTSFQHRRSLAVEGYEQDIEVSIGSNEVSIKGQSPVTFLKSSDKEHSQVNQSYNGEYVKDQAHLLVI